MDEPERTRRRARNTPPSPYRNRPTEDWSIMATPKDHTNAELANRLEEHADRLFETRHSPDAESIVRLAAERLRRTSDQASLIPRLVAEVSRIATLSADPDLKNGRRPLPPVPGLVSELAKIANTTSDADARRRLRRVLGEG